MEKNLFRNDEESSMGLSKASVVEEVDFFFHSFKSSEGKILRLFSVTRNFGFHEVIQFLL